MLRGPQRHVPISCPPTAEQRLFSVEISPGKFVFPLDLYLLAMRHVCITVAQKVFKDFDEVEHFL